MSFDPRIADTDKGMFVERFGAKSFDDMQKKDNEREPTLAAFEAGLGDLSKAYRHTGGTTDHLWRANGTDTTLAQRGEGKGDVEPWLDEQRPAYADVIVGAWLKMMEACMREEEWQRVRTWQGLHEK